MYRRTMTLQFHRSMVGMTTVIHVHSCTGKKYVYAEVEIFYFLHNNGKTASYFSGRKIIINLHL